MGGGVPSVRSVEVNMAAVMRSVRRVRGEVALLPRILITPKRSDSGGKGAEHSGGSKTLVSFPAKQPHVWPTATGENAVHPSTILHHLEVGRESSVDPGQKTERSEPRQEEDTTSSSSSSSDSDSDSDLEEEEKRTEAAEKKKDQSNQKRGSKDQKTQTEQPETQEQEILGGEKAREDLTYVPSAVGTLTLKPKMRNIPQPGEKATSGDQDCTGEQSEDVAPAVNTKSGKKTLSGGRDLAGEELVDVAPAVDTQVHNIPQSVGKTPSGGQDNTGEDLVDVAPALDTKSVEKTPSGGQDHTGKDSVDVAPALDTRSVEKTPSGGQDLTGEDLVDVAPALNTKSVEKTPSGGQDYTGKDSVDVAPALDTRSVEKTPSGGQDLTGEDLVDVDTRSVEKTPSGGQDVVDEDLVDVAPTCTEEPAHGEAEEGRLASRRGQDVGETQSSDGNNKDPSGELSVSSPDRLVESDDLSPVASLTPPPPPSAPPPEEPFDNSKYQNQQHFSYTPLTFVDHDVDLSKYRLPQPSSGKPSPYH